MAELFDSKTMSSNDSGDNIESFVKKLPKVELHLHLDGCMRPSTLYELAMEKGFPTLPPSVTSAQSFAEFLEMRDNGNLTEFLQKFHYMVPQVAGDRKALERVAWELCLDKKSQGVVYFETRYAPHLLVGDPPAMRPEDVVEAVNEGLRKGEAETGVMARSILCCMRGMPEIALPVVRMALQYRGNGVVGFDVAGDESSVSKDRPDDPLIVEAFQFAYDNDVHRTVHAGEAGPAWDVEEAVERLHAERIGHGYHVLQDPSIYSRYVLQNPRIHMEECPYSSIKTGAFVPDEEGWKKHPLRTFYEDGVSFSINTDDSTVTGHSLLSDYSIVVSPSGVGLPPAALIDAVRFAADAAFLDGAEKETLKRIVEERLKAMTTITAETTTTTAGTRTTADTTTTAATETTTTTTTTTTKCTDATTADMTTTTTADAKNDSNEASKTSSSWQSGCQLV